MARSAVEAPWIAPTLAEFVSGETANEDDLALLRNELDELDEAVRLILKRRVELSRRIQSIRIESGGARVDLQREKQVIDGYRRTFEQDGAELALAILHISRGSADAQR
jgi:chorismate mutase